jgi:hypothetical protein
MKKNLVILISIITIFLCTSNVNAQTSECEARIQHDGTRIQKNKIYSRWIIGHDPWRWATVSFRYRIVYIDEDNKERSIRGAFRQLIMGKDDIYTELKNTRHRPAFVTLSEYSDLSCDRF